MFLDYLVIGGGIFGSHAAKLLQTRAAVGLVERESTLLSRASKQNQTRLHTGAHYLRAPRTALIAKKYHDRFLKDHEYAINKTSKHIYGLAKYGSLTDGKGFERFCDWLEIEYERIAVSDYFDSSRITDSYMISEYSYDPYLIAQSYQNEIQNSDIRLFLNSEIIDARKIGRKWSIKIRNIRDENISIEAGSVINATYSNLNSVSNLFTLPESQIKHEYSELLLLHAPTLIDTAITVMDGPYFSITPYGLTGLHVLSSVVYTHHTSTQNFGKKFSCQIVNGVCEVNKFHVCQNCRNKPRSAQRFMLNQLSTYVPNSGPVFNHGQLETIKTTWGIEDYRNERQTSIKKLSSKPDFYNVLSGKVSSIYEIEEVLDGH